MDAPWKRRMEIPSILKMGMSFNGRQMRWWDQQEPSFCGACGLKSNGNGRMFNNTIEASFRFVEGSSVTFEDLWFKVGGNYTAWPYGMSQLSLVKQVYFEITTQQIVNFYLYGYAFEKWHWIELGWRVPENTKVSSECPASELSIQNSTIFSKIDLSEGLNWP